MVDALWIIGAGAVLLWLFFATLWRLAPGEDSDPRALAEIFGVWSGVLAIVLTVLWLCLVAAHWGLR